MDGMTRTGGKGPLGKIKALASAKRQMSDIGGMMHKMAEASMPPDQKKAQNRQKVGVVAQVARDEMRRRRKLERQRKKRNRKR